MRLDYSIYGTKLFLLMFNVRRAPHDDNIMKKGWKTRKPPPEKADLPIYVFRDKDLEVRGMVLQNLSINTGRKGRLGPIIRSRRLYEEKQV
jgi:hypothetical protein